MGYKRRLKRNIALLLGITLLMPVWEIQSTSALVDQTIPVLNDDGTVDWGAKAAVYWNPGTNEEIPCPATHSNASESADLATGSDVNEATDRATGSNVIASAGLASGSDTATGQTPDTAVASLNTAVRQAEKLSRQLKLEMSEIVIYAMNPLIIRKGTTCTVQGKGTAIVPWHGNGDNADYVFIVEGGQLSLDNITLRSADGAAPGESSLIYMSSGSIRLGERVESYGTFVLDYTRREPGQEPVIELMNGFDYAGYFRLDLQIPDTRESDVTVIKALFSDENSANDFKDAFPLTAPKAEWELLVAEQNRGILRDTTAGRRGAGASELSQKSLIAHKVENSISGKLWLDENANEIMDSIEAGVAGYAVSLYRTDDLSTAVQVTETQEDGTYRFEGMGPGSYVVGIASETVGEAAYLLPSAGIAGDNRFRIIEVNGTARAYSDTTVITTALGTTAAGLDAGLSRNLNLYRYSGSDFVNLPLGGNVLAGGDETKLVVMEADGDPDSGYYRAYSANESGMRAALYDLYSQNAAGADYIMYIGTSITGLPANIFANTTTANGTGDVSFASLQGRLKTMVITGNPDDPVTDAPATAEPAVTSISTVTTIGERFFGCHLILRNIKHRFYTGSTAGVYMNGYVLTLGGGSWQLATTRYFGGSSSGSATPAEGTAGIIVYSTGTGDSHFIGGMRTGILNGNATVEINDTSGNTIHIHGGGIGTSAAGADITGSVTNLISGMAANSGGLGRFLGGVEYGTVGGPITNRITGDGRFDNATVGYAWSTANSCLIGGSLYGDIGSDATLGGAVDTSDLEGLKYTNDYIIRNAIDTSGYTYGRAFYLGTNYQSGTVKGNVINLVRAGTNNKGSLSVFSGGSGYYAAIGGTWPGSFTVDTATAKAANVEAGLDAAKAAAGYQLYGNITSVIYSGSVCYANDNEHWLRGAGWGYMEGNAYTEAGTEGVVYYGGNDSYSYSVSTNTQGYYSYLDMVGGGGNISANNSFCIKGDTTLVTRNVLARWTYGGSFGGVQVGNSLRRHYGGVVDTCEGTGYDSYLHVGDGRTEVYGGQVDWFLCGGGYNNRYQDGNVSVEVFDAPDLIINASLGGTYGVGSTHLISGNSAVVVHGGNFSGTARGTPAQGFSSGPSYLGKIYGDASMTIDLRGNRYGFSLGASDNISAGRQVGATTGVLGTNSDNTITLNILTDEAQPDLLSGLNIYGDCASSSAYAAYTYAGQITININAPGASVGNVYATSYANISSGLLRRNVAVNLVSVAALTGLRPGNGTETINNTVAAASAAANRKAVINVGPQSEDPNELLGEREDHDTSDGLPHRINISTNGIVGFMEMDIKKRLLVAQQGDILNGLSAAVANHGISYHQFGNLTLHAGQGMAGAGLGLAADGSTRIIAGSAQAVCEGKIYLESAGQSDRLVLTDIAPGDSTLLWFKTGNITAETGLLTNWFGADTGWRVITLNPDKTTAAAITPANFMGLEAASGKTFIGDNDTHFTGNHGYAVAIPGTVYRWEVTAGAGKVSHNVPVSASVPTVGQPLTAYGTVAADTPSENGMLAIPGEYIPDPVSYPVFSFIPDSTDSWVEHVEIDGSDRNISDTPHYYQLAAGGAGETKTWTAAGDDKEFSFHIKAQFASLPVTRTIAVSKRVEGNFADKNKDFTFKIYFQNSDGTALASGTQLAYVGSITESGAESPGDGTLTLDSEGSAALVLKHGQKITITAALPGKVRIIEAADSNYRPAILDSGAAGIINGADTGVAELGEADRTFDFVNTRTAVISVGILLNNGQGMRFLILSMLMMLGMVITGHSYSRQKRRRQND